MRRGDPDRTGLRKRPVRNRRYRPGAAISPRRFSKENSRCGGVKGRAEIPASSGERAGYFPSTDPNRSKAGAGSRGKFATALSHAMLKPCMPAGERVVWDYSSNSLVVVMTHQKLNIGV